MLTRVRSRVKNANVGGKCFHDPSSSGRGEPSGFFFSLIGIVALNHVRYTKPRATSGAKWKEAPPAARADDLAI